METLAYSQLLGMEVLDQDCEKIGTVADVVIGRSGDEAVVKWLLIRGPSSASGLDAVKRLARFDRVDAAEIRRVGERFIHIRRSRP